MVVRHQRVDCFLVCLKSSGHVSPNFKYRCGLETVPNPDPEVQCSRMAQCHTVYPSASPDLQNRIHHCLEVESVTCDDHSEPKKRGASNTHQSQQMDYVTLITNATKSYTHCVWK